MQSFREQFATEVEGYMERRELTPSRFGILALGDPNFVFELRKGRAVSMDVADRVRRFMRDSEAA
ncbi:MAG: hypothetical protein VW338_00105 [Rhodospirillaceae bacterium]